MMKNKIIGLFMLAAVSMVGIGGCGKDKDKEEPKGKSGFTSIDVKATSKDLEAEVTLKFEKGTKLDEHYIKFEGSAVEDGKTKANSTKEVKDPVKLADLGTAGEQELKFTVTGLKAGKITVSLVKGDKHEAVKDKDGKDIKKEFDVKAAAKPSAEITEVKVASGKPKAVLVTIKLENGLKAADLDKYSLEFNVNLDNDAKSYKLPNDLQATNGEVVVKVEAKEEIDAKDKVEVTLKSSDDKAYLVKNSVKIKNSYA